MALFAALIAISVALGWWSGESEQGSPIASDGEQGRADFVVTDERRQRIEGWGASVVGADEPLVDTRGLSERAVRRLDRLIFGEHGIDLVRVFGPGDPGSGRVRPWTSPHRVIQFMNRVRPYGVRFAFTGGGAPLWMREGNSPKGELRAGAEAAYARFLARNLEVASEAGVPFEWTGIGNEPDNYGRFWVAMHPGQAATVYRELAAEIGRLDLATRLMLGDNLGWRQTYDYARFAEGDAAVQRLAAVIATHGYDGLEQPTIERVVDLARDTGLSLWMTEWVSGCTADPTSATTQLDLALGWAQRIAFDLNIGDAQAWFMLQAVPLPDHGVSCGIVVPQPGNGLSFVPNKRYWMLRQFTSVAPPGAYRYEVASDSDRIAAVAFRRGERTGLVLTNPGPRAVTARIDLGDAGILTVRRTSAVEDFTLVHRSSLGGGELWQALPARSITTLELVTS